VVEASSGSTAVSEAYFARMLGLPFIAVMPERTSPEKISLIEFQGAKCHLVADPAAVVASARRLAADLGGHFMDQFTYAERATDWRGNNNIAESIYTQLALERHPVPAWVVVGAGTGGTSATIGRYARYRRYATKICVVDPESSAFWPAYLSQDWSMVTGRGSRIEGIGRPRVEPSFQPTGRGPDDPGTGRGVVGRDAGRIGDPGPASGRVDRHQPVGCVRSDRGDARGRPPRFGRHADLRRR
jgi:cysteine synthase A